MGTIQNIDKRQVWVSNYVMDDWETRGLDGNITLIRNHGRRKLIEVTQSVLDGLVFDAELQTQDCMGCSQSMKRAWDTFVQQTKNNSQ